MKKCLLTVLTLSLVMVSCNRQSKNTPALYSGIHPEYFDTTALPQEDFYQFACGGWMRMHPLTPEYSRYGTFNQLGDTTQLQVQELIAEIAGSKYVKGSVEQKIGDMYKMGMDSVTLNKQGYEPVKGMLEQIAKIKDFKEFEHQIAEFHRYGISALFTVFGEANPENSDMTIAWLWQSGMGMGDRDYYLKSENQALRQKYQEMLTRLFSVTHFDDLMKTDSKTMATSVLAFETEMAKIAMDKNDARDPQKTFNYRSMTDLQNLWPQFNFDNYFKSLNLTLDSVNVGSPDYIGGLSKVVDKADIGTLKAYLAWHLIQDAAPYLSDEIVEVSFNYYGKALSGSEENKPRWKRVVNTVNNNLGEAIGQMYVKKYFPKEAKDRMLNIVNNLKEALAERINENKWMTDATKAKAIEKLNAFRVKIGYPDKWRDYSALKIENDSYYANILRANEFEINYRLSKINKPVDKDEWLMYPQIVNAYYNPSTNEICFPAAILQPPFFDMNADDAVNYGAIGVVIGHEMTHGFDDKGSQYDKDGNLSNWWQEEDAEKFEQRTKVLVDYFNNIEVLPGIHADGNFTLGENIADNGGLQVSYLAFTKALAKGEIQQEMDGFTPQQRFFIAYATVWANNIRDEEIKHLTKEDPHSLGKWRVNGTLPHIDAFVDAFRIKQGDKMYLAPENRALIW
ncbi:MAG: M13 family metallopeptidase [Bacteroidales bacterium]|nr:M13 family metallopeptidase [Bacteroidales bacterium]